MPAKEEMPSTLKRSPKKAQRTWAKTHDSAADQYGERRSRMGKKELGDAIQKANARESRKSRS